MHDAIGQFCSALWEPVYGGSILHSWVWQGGRDWTTRCGKKAPMGNAKFNSKKCTKCLKVELQIKSPEEKIIKNVEIR